MHNRHGQKREKQVIDHSTGDKTQNHDIVYLHYSFILILTFSVIIVSKSNYDFIDIVSIHLLTLICMTDFDG